VVIEELPRSGSSSITPKSLDVKRGGNFAVAKFMTLFTVKWIFLLEDIYP